ncbi:MAG: UDP-N-acetylglucosamine 1-carboxyvinyltransferase [Firmicutes bacterium]|nr:UDP-N-acetylglucosamine 1-carboxyvinyltransferase [Bacillota bacterium]
MDKLVIEGGHTLEGEIYVSGAKNSAVAILPATLLTEETCIIKNLPSIKDVYYINNILLQLGAEVEESGCKFIINSLGVDTYEVDFELSKKLRASYYFVGALLGRFKKARVPFPGGCDIGIRPIDQHIKGFEALGARIKIEHGIIWAEADELIGTSIFLDVVSVGATINIMLAACLAKGTTVIENAAKEPYIVDTANFLNAMGANIKGAGTDEIKIKGVERLGGCEHCIIPDQMEAGTFMIAAAASRGNVLVKNVIPTHLDSISAKMREMGIKVIENGDSLQVVSNGRPRSANIKTMPYPGFPTDLQQPMSVLLSIAEGTAIVTESIYDGRFKHVDELRRMGAKINVEGRVAIIEGIKKLSGAPVCATDLRAGAAMVIAGLTAEGETVINNLTHIDRGYEKLEEKLLQIGAKLKRIP